ncbi:hypothetical protein OsI_09451 [Oryza sativa Indica Group]|uniref:Auxin-responsive protein n=1 Tax=Oryza sativa subsp. indica TaxID=39946 RepID=B8AEV0_ORYSI|nr:hypothetical protein OsI_09451 [Oryza sativa Indica Group]
MRGGAAGPTAGEPPGTEAEAEEVEESSAGDDEELELGLSLGSKKQQQQQHAPCRILTARDLQPAAALSPDSSVSSSSPAAAAAGGKRAEGPTATTSPGTVASGHPHSSFGVVGWPPIRQFRMNSLFNQAKENTSETDTKKTATNESDVQKDKEEGEKKGRVAGWVKVNMDGEVIGRKDNEIVLQIKIIAMLHIVPNNTKSLKLLDNSAEYQLTYEDRDGDWMLVGDVPWEMFVSSVKRLRIMRTSDANGLGQRYQGIHRTIASTRGRS